MGRLWLLLGERLEEFLSSAIHLLPRQILIPCRDGPAVSVRIDERTHAIAPELIVDRHAGLSAGCDGAIEEGVAILDVQPQRRRRTTVGLRALVVHHRIVDEDS